MYAIVYKYRLYHCIECDNRRYLSTQDSKTFKHTHNLKYKIPLQIGAECFYNSKQVLTFKLHQ